MNLRLTKRAVRFWWQRRIRGWDDSDTWSLDHAFQQWAVPRLKRYLEVADKAIVIEGDYRQALLDMIEGFSADVHETNYVEAVKKQEKAYEQFAKWHGALWW